MYALCIRVTSCKKERSGWVCITISLHRKFFFLLNFSDINGLKGPFDPLILPDISNFLEKDPNVTDCPFIVGKDKYTMPGFQSCIILK